MNPLRNNGTGNLLRQFLEFKKSMQGKDPQKVLDELMSSGKYTPEQLEWAKQKAQEFRDFLK